MKKLAAMVVTVIGFFAIWMFSQKSESRTTHWTCEMNAFFTGDRAHQIQAEPVLEGQGLMNCRNVTGFNFDLPVHTRLKIKHDPNHSNLEQIKVTLYSKPFVISRDLDQIYDDYELHGEPVLMAMNREAQFLLSGKSGVVVPAQISIPEESQGSWEVSGLEVAFDETAPAGAF